MHLDPPAAARSISRHSVASRLMRPLPSARFSSARTCLLVMSGRMLGSTLSFHSSAASCAGIVLG